jgi:hypothetical protein
VNDPMPVMERCSISIAYIPIATAEQIKNACLKTGRAFSFRTISWIPA